MTASSSWDIHCRHLPVYGCMLNCPCIKKICHKLFHRIKICYDGPEWVENISTWSVSANCVMFYYSLTVPIECISSGTEVCRNVRLLWIHIGWTKVKVSVCVPSLHQACVCDNIYNKSFVYGWAVQYVYHTYTVLRIWSQLERFLNVFFFVFLLIIMEFSAKFHFNFTYLFKVCCQKCWNSCCRNFLTVLNGGYKLVQGIKVC